MDDSLPPFLIPAYGRFAAEHLDCTTPNSLLLLLHTVWSELLRHRAAYVAKLT